jgi:16S rRNA (adenine1518-N6/adenine1519-N6)-dimethyltransferase
MGQNFLVDPRPLERIVTTIGAAAEDRVLEIGAGLGALTELLLATGAFVHAVERDAGFIRVLTDRFKGSPHLQLIRSTRFPRHDRTPVISWLYY